MRTMGGLWTKTQAQRKEAAALRQAQQPQVQDQEASLNVEVRRALQSVTENADNEAPGVRIGRRWGEGAARGAVRGGGRGGGGGGRPGRGRGAGRGRGGRVEGGLRGTCPRCGGDYARSYLWYHQRRCVVEEGGGRVDGAGQEADRDEANEDQGQGAEQEAVEDQGAEQDQVATQDQGAVQDQGDIQEHIHESEDESAEEDEETDDQDILDEVDDMERTVFASPLPRRTRGQKRTAMSLSTDEESENTFVAPPSQRPRRQGFFSDISFPSAMSSPTPQHPAVSQPTGRAGMQLSFDPSPATRGLANEILYEQQQARLVQAARPLRLRSQDTPEGSRILDIGEERLRSVVTRLAGRGLTPVDASTPAAENIGSPLHPDISAVLQPVQLGFR